ncbi:MULTISPECIES: hypothetical protein [Amycolatopsis]|uniref:Uncharacterized protein n=1 Tax=Amycolatopsis bullii TaxID=941987 RepID=A0ABQ3K6G6_9PSEU|nr:hypothetical protein [Amycolatopsis bullii]GHG01314.1 hypothetical protein GCM10017567_15660 [Amycolatopsis bullii]
MLELVRGLLTYAIVPGVMAAMLFAGVVIAVRAESAHRISAIAGFGFGIIAFVIYFLMSEDTGVATKAGLTSVDGAWLPIMAGLLLGFTVLWGVQKATRLHGGIQGLITLFLTATSSIALFGYFFDSPMRNFAVLFAAGSLGGILLYFVFYSRRVLELLRKPARAK